MYRFLAPNLQRLVQNRGSNLELEEIRLRLTRPLMVKDQKGFAFLNEIGQPCAPEEGYRVTLEDMQRTMQIITKNSWYACEDELGRIFDFTWGHRVGISGRAVLENGRLKTVKHISSLNFRIAKEILGAADEILPHVALPREGKLYSTLIVSPPGCGKTTLLRDLTRQVANLGFQVAVIDERSEIGSCYEGVPQLDVGMQTDVLDGYPKTIGISHAVRALGPEVVVTDEIGHPEDAFALAELARCGVKVFASCHGSSFSQIKNKSWAVHSLSVFEVVVILSRRLGPGTIESVLRI